MTRLAFVALAFFSSFCFADKLSLDIEAKDIFMKGTFAFQPGAAMKVSGKDASGRPYELEVLSKMQKDETIQFVCRLLYESHKVSVSVITKKGLEGVVASGPKDGPPDLKFGANWTE